MAHAYTNFLYHIVFATRDREPYIEGAFRPRLHAFIGGIIRGIGGVPIIANGVEDHVHVLTRLPQNRAVSEMIRDIKANSSRWVRRTFPRTERFGWQRGYGAFTVSESVADRVRAYIADQEAHHRARSFEDEFVALLRVHGVAYDPAKIWD